MLEGLTDIDSGEALIDGIDVKKQPNRVKEIIGVQLQANEYFDHLTLADLLRLFSKLGLAAQRQARLHSPGKPIEKRQRNTRSRLSTNGPTSLGIVRIRGHCASAEAVGAG
jgi:ABC-type Na+ transport system ATPase subunit NatA